MVRSTIMLANVVALAAPVTHAQAGPDTGSTPTPSALVFDGTTVIDVRSGALQANQRVVVVGTRIQAAGPASRVVIPVDARIVKATGTYLIPGLWDMHIHSKGNEEIAYPLFIANGITGVRDMSHASLETLHEWRGRIAAGTHVGPRVVASGPAIFVPSMNEPPNAPRWRGRTPWGVFPTSPEDARRLVDSLKRAGADFLKIYDGHPREVYFAVMEEARRVGIPVAGHLVESVTAAEAAEAGQRSIEHYLNCDASAAPGGKLVVAMPDLERCRVLAAIFRKHDTWFSVANPFTASDPAVADWVTLLRYWPDSVLFRNHGEIDSDSAMMAMSVASSKVQEGRGRGTAARAERYKRPDGVYGALHRAGIRMLAGTDTSPGLFVMLAVPGFSLHTLLESMVLDGLTPLQALQTATLNPAEYFYRLDSLGTIAAGKLADLVLLDADPLVDIHNTRRIRAVVANGRFFDRGDLDVMLLDAEQRARGVRRVP